MVMEATPNDKPPSPSPQCVGREFVRQYYTLLNEAPQFLHRFYSHNSSFVHGGDGKPGEEELAIVIGQSDIHRKIMSLKFHDCHAKIRYVDSQATIGTGVVVQVTGELSNDGQPMRRFMQTFVLAPQSATKYYVHNDIFRYQDEVFNDSDYDEEEEACVDQSQGQGPPTTNHQMIQGKQEAGDGAFMESNNSENEKAVDKPQSHPSQVLVSAVTEAKIPNGHKGLTNENISSTTALGGSDRKAAVDVSTGPIDASQLLLDDAELVQASQDGQASWAQVVESRDSPVLSGSIGPTITPITNIDHKASVSYPSVSYPEKSTAYKPAKHDSNFGNKVHEVKPQRPDDGRSLEDKRVERQRHPESHQIFVGNLPSTITEQQLRELFKSYGKVVEVRVNRNSSRTPFGFVVFENEMCAQRVLEHKSIDFNGQKINIEEKKGKQPGSKPTGRRDSGKYRGGGGGIGNRGAFSNSREEGGNREHNRMSGNRHCQQPIRR